MNALEAIEQLKSTTCRCGEPKQQRNSFCQTCYYLLSPTVRRALYNQVGCGYEQAYDFACRILESLEAKQ